MAGDHDAVAEGGWAHGQGLKDMRVRCAWAHWVTHLWVLFGAILPQIAAGFMAR